MIATAVAIPFLALNLIVLGKGLAEILHHPDLISRWRLDLTAHGDWTSVVIASGIIFPKLALGLSGFETGVAVMPLISEAIISSLLPISFCPISYVTAFFMSLPNSITE